MVPRNRDDADELFQMGFLVGVAVFAFVVGAGYAVRQRSRIRSRRYYHDN